MKHPLLAAAIVSASALLMSGCIHRNATAAATLPPLDVPAPPPRIVETAEVEPRAPMGAIQEPERTIPPGGIAPPAGPTPSTAKPPDAVKTDAPVQVEGPKQPDEAPRVQPPATLQTTPVQQEVELESRCRGLLLRATNDLNRVDYGRLNANGKSQYDSAKGFIRLSEDALRMKNLVYANTLAEKAADLAAQLSGR
jgi:hypothetical protein